MCVAPTVRMYCSRLVNRLCLIVGQYQTNYINDDDDDDIVFTYKSISFNDFLMNGNIGTYNRNYILEDKYQILKHKSLDECIDQLVNERSIIREWGESVIDNRTTSSVVVRNQVVRQERYIVR